MARRVVLVLADGLRPDALTPGLMPSLHSLGEGYARARDARTVRPSVTVAALASLATGVGPATHRLTEPGLGFLPGLRRLRPLAGELARAHLPTAIICAKLGAAPRSIAWGVHPKDHDLPHLVNDRITLILGGHAVRRSRALERDVSILDVPPTVLWYLGLPLPVSYEGRVLHDAFEPAPAMAVA